jgi:hypothetical protein
MIHELHAFFSILEVVSRNDIPFPIDPIRGIIENFGLVVGSHDLAPVFYIERCGLSPPLQAGS